MRSVIICLWFALTLSLRAADWIRAELNTNAMVWGRPGGLMFAIPPSGFHPPEPRGLIRLGYPVLPNNAYDLINFIAIEPVVKGRKGFSELERSALDSRPGKRLTVATNEISGTISTIAPGVEELSITIHVERFQNGAAVILEIRQRSDTPDEITMITRAAPNSAAMDFCILTATMGNRTRARELCLKDETINARQLYPDYRANDFAPHTVYPLDRLRRLENGDATVAITSDEQNPTATLPFPERPDHFWNYKGDPVTQYWKKPAADLSRDLTAVINARHVYWGSLRPIPNGISIENFELREPFHNAQRFTFGITRRSPRELGLTSK
jgi:hypothetical protein